MNAEKIQTIVSLLEKQSPKNIAFEGVTFGELLAIAKIALAESAAEEGIESAHSTMAQFMEKQDG